MSIIVQVLYVSGSAALAAHNVSAEVPEVVFIFAVGSVKVLKYREAAI
jgi:hypothetical protein